jgi:transcriptional regulator with XRE-family HTH domain
VTTPNSKTKQNDSSQEIRTPGETLGSIVRKARNSKHLTQAECASRCGLGRRHFQKIEAGEVNPPLAFFQTLGNVLETRPCYFLNGESIDSPLSEHGILCDSEVLNLLPTPVFIASRNLEIIYKNSKFEEAFGIDRKTLAEIIHQESDRNRLLEILSPRGALNPSINASSLSGKYEVTGQNQASIQAHIIWSLLKNENSPQGSAILGVVSLLSLS